MPYRLLIFDFDGTLADSLPWFTQVLNDVARRYGFRTVTPDEMQKLRALGNREIVRRLGVPTWKMPFIAAHMRRLARNAADEIRPFNGVADLLVELHARGVKVAIVSSNGEAAMRQVLGEAVWAKLDHVEAGIAMFGKAPRLARTAKRLGVSPQDVLTVGDETRDIEAARRAGMAVAAVTWGYATRDALERASPDLLIDDLDKLLAVSRP